MLYQGLTEETASGDTTALTLANYTNQSLESVTGALDALDLPYVVFPEDNPLVAPEFVHRTVPEAGTVVPEGQVIELYYRPTEALVAIPNVEGREIDEAKQLLGADGFQVAEISQLSPVAAAGIVIRTEPAAGELVAQEQIVTIVVSAGPDQVSVPPTVIGDELDVARQLLESDAYGLTVTVVPPSTLPSLMVSTE